MSNKDRQQQNRQQAQQQAEQQGRGQTPSFTPVDESPFTKAQEGNAIAAQDTGVNEPQASAQSEATSTQDRAEQMQAAGAVPSDPAEEVKTNNTISALLAATRTGEAKTAGESLIDKVAADTAEKGAEVSILVTSVRATLAVYQDIMNPEKAVSTEDIRSQQLTLLRMLQNVVNSEDHFHEGMEEVLSAFRDPEMTSLKEPDLQRGFDNALSHLPVKTQRLMRSLFALFAIASGISNPKTLYQVFDLKGGLDHEQLSDNVRHRLVSYFS